MITHHYLAFAVLGLFLCFAQCDTVTYPGLGTFKSTDFHHPIWRPIGLAPQSPHHIDPLFMLYTRKHSKDGQRLIWNDTKSILDSDFDGKRETKIICHGFIDNRDFANWMAEMRDAFLESGDYNVILVDWHKGNFFPYTQATANTRVTGAMIGVQIEALCAARKTTPSNFHLLGHSLGSHIVGYAGKFLKGEVGHITGLDPAGPYYEGIVPEGRLWHTDAQFVESIHTDATHLIPKFGFGMYETCSHVDFFPNGGKKQPGCDQERVTSIVLQGIEEGARRIVACNHQRAIDFYTASINHKTAPPMGYVCENHDDFIWGKCKSCGEHGENCSMLGPKSIEYKTKFDIKKSIGKRFFLDTGAHAPYFKFHYAVHIRMSNQEKKHEHLDQHGKIELTFVSDNGDTSTVPFNDEDRIFHVGKSYNRLILLDMDPVHFSSMSLDWTHGGFDILKSQLAVENVEIVGMNPSNSGSMITKKFCNPSENHEISNGKKVTFKAC